MAVFRVTTYLEGPQCGGSEQWDFQFPENTSLVSLWTQLKSVYESRVAALANDWRGIGYRVTQIRDDAFLPVQRVSFFNLYALTSPDTWDSAPKDESVKVRFYAQDALRNRVMNMMGFPKEIIRDGNAILSLASWEGAFQNWRTKVLQWPVGWIQRTQSAPTAITGYTESDVGIITLTAAGAVPGAVNAPGKFRVLLAGINGKSELNDVWTAENYLPTGGGAGIPTFNLVGRFGVIPYQGGGTVRTFTESFTPVGLNGPAPSSGAVPESIAATSIGKRQRGRAFGSGRGRASARIRT